MKSSTLKRNLLFIGTLGGVLLGFFSGVYIKTLEPSETVESVIAYPGELFFRALKLMILPSIIFSLILGSTSLDIKSNGRIAVRTFTYFLSTSLLNTVLGVVLAIAIHPGNPADKLAISGTELNQFQGTQPSLVDNLFDLGRNIIPPNIFTTVFESTQTVYKTKSLPNTNQSVSVKVIEDRKGTNFLGVIVISIVIGSVLSTLGKEGKPLVNVITVCDTVITKTVRGIMWATPIGVLSLICGKVIQAPNVNDLMTQLGLFIVTVTVGIFLYQLVFMQLLYFLFLRENPFKFYLGVLPGAMTGFAVQSSAGALPVTLQCLDENVKVDARISRFVVPLGVTINMDGTAMFVTIASIFIAQMNGVELSFQNYITICLLATAVSIATATTPSASLSIIFIILQAIGLPVSDIGLLFSVDWFLDRLRTTNNVLGDCYTAAIVERLSQKELKRMDELNEEVKCVES